MTPTIKEIWDNGPCTRAWGPEYLGGPSIKWEEHSRVCAEGGTCDLDGTVNHEDVEC